jgi:hypothetical protein
MSNARIPKIAAIVVVWLAACEKPMSSPISSSREDLEQVYLLHDPALAGHQRAEAVVVGTDGITVLASANPKGETEHTWLMRLGDDGTVAWERHYEPAYGTGRAITSRRRGFAIAGDVRRGAMAYQASLLAVDATGAVTGAASLGPRGVTGFYAVQARSDDAIVAAGTSRWKGWIVSTDSALQQPAEAPLDVDEVNGLAVLPSGEVAVIAAVEKSTTGFGLTRVAAVAGGAVRWQSQLPSNGRGDPVALVALPDGQLLAIGNGGADSDRRSQIAGGGDPDGSAGGAGGGAPGGIDPTRVWLARVDAAGQPAWEHMLDGAPAAWRARAAAAFPDGSFAVAGETAPPDGQRAPHVWRFAGDGTVRWQRSYGGPGGEIVTGLAATPDGGLVMVGSTAQGPGKTNVWIVRLAANGDVVWQRVFGTPAR